MNLLESLLLGRVPESIKPTWRHSLKLPQTWSEREQCMYVREAHRRALVR